MDWGLIIGIMGVLATLLTVLYAVKSNRKSNPKRQLDYTVNSRRLVDSAPGAKFEIAIGGIAVEDPHLVELRLNSNSRADIPTSAFDARRPLAIRVQPGGAFVLADDTNGGIEVYKSAEDGWDLAVFEIAPQLLRKGATLSLDFISSGKPHITIDSPLIDIDVNDVTSSKRFRFALPPTLIISGASIVAAAALTFLPDSYFPYLALALIALSGGLSGYGLGESIVRAKRRARRTVGL